MNKGGFGTLGSLVFVMFGVLVFVSLACVCVMLDGYYNQAQRTSESSHRLVISSVRVVLIRACVCVWVGV